MQSTDVGGGWHILSGTSQVALAAAGCAALLIEAGKVATIDELADRLTTSPAEITRGNRTCPRLECVEFERVNDFTVELPGGDDDAW
jgi:hypothetical protein